jgi:hypothetical protein
MKKLSKIAVSGLLVSGLLAFAQPSMVMAAPKANPKSPTNQGSTPRGKPFVALNSRIDALQLQIDTLIGQVTSIEAWQANADAALLQLQKDSAANAAAIAVLQGEMAAVSAALETKQDIISGTCPDGQFVYEIAQNPATLICRAVVGANGLTAFTAEVTQDVPSNGNLDLAADCPAGSIPIGGSYATTPDLTIDASGITATGYSVSATNITAAAIPLSVTATCLGVAP